MSPLRGPLLDLISAHLQGRVRARNAFAHARLPDWLDRRLHWNADHDRSELERSERSSERPIVGKDPTIDR